MSRTCVLWLFVLLWWSASLAVNPLPPKTPEKIASIDCTGLIAYSATGSGPVHPTGIVAYKHSVISLAVTWDREVGVFTCVCSGLYQFSFSGSTEDNTR